MLGSTNIIAFVPTKGSEKARAFYEGVQGLRFVKDDRFGLVLDANGIMVRVAKAGEFKPATVTPEDRNSAALFPACHDSPTSSSVASRSCFVDPAIGAS